jgi:hypothetical protein
MKRLFSVFFIVLLCVSMAGWAYAQQEDNGSVVPEPEKQKGVVEYQEQDLDKEFTFRGQKFVGSKYTDNADFEAVKTSLENNLLQLRYDAYAMGHLLEYAKDEAFRKAYAQDFSRLMTNAISDISDPIGRTWQMGVQSTKAIGDLETGLNDLGDEMDELADEVATNGRYIDALWMEEHGIQSITVRVEIDKIGRDLRVLDKNGEEISAVFLTSTGDLGGLQKAGTDTTKLVAVSYAPKYKSYGILVSPDVYAGEPVESIDTKDVREVELHTAFSHLKKSGAEEILAGPGFDFDSQDIDQVLK